MPCSVFLVDDTLFELQEFIDLPENADRRFRPDPVADVLSTQRP